MLVLFVQSCGRPWSVREGVLLPYVVAVVAVVVVVALGAVTVMGVPFFVLHVSMVREYEGTKVTAMMVRGTGEVWFW